jgi:hypothetical protein
MSVAPDIARKALIDETYGAFKSAGLAAKADAFGFVGHDAQATRLNWKAPGTFDLTIGGGAPTFLVTVVHGGNKTVDFTGTTLKGNGGADLSALAGDSMRCTFDGTNWHCSIIDATA